jgi:hypothetical protein
MASDDRDRTFEKALARQLRSSASSGVDTNALAGVPADPRAELCPDPETLAAYHDGSLSLDERNLWKQHVLSCDNCQFVLAHLATPLDVPVHQDINENVLVAQQRVSSARAASPAPIARPSRPHSLRWLWLVPAGAIAATLIAWVSLQEPKPSPLSPPPSVEIAENRQSPVATPSAKSAPAVPRERKEKDQLAASSVGAVGGAVSGNRDDASKDSQVQDRLAQQVPSQNAAPPAHGPYLTQQKQQQQISRFAAGSAGAVDQKKLDAQAAPRLPLNGREAHTPQPPPPPPAPTSSEPGFIADGSLPAPSREKVLPAAPAPSPAPSNPSELKSSSTDLTTTTISGASTALEVSAAPQSAAKARALMRAAALQNPHVFAAPGGKQLWRVGPAGSLEHSKDKGLNWIPQISGVYTDLLAGSAPSAKVSWIVGSSGTILRTTDGGTHWTKLDSPVTNDLTGVRATDSAHALIWSVPDPQTGLIKIYQTSDGGVTWSPASDR